MSLQIEQGLVSLVLPHLPTEAAGRPLESGFLSPSSARTGR